MKTVIRRATDEDKGPFLAGLEECDHIVRGRNYQGAQKVISHECPACHGGGYKQVTVVLDTVMLDTESPENPGSVISYADLGDVIRKQIKRYPSDGSCQETVPGDWLEGWQSALAALTMELNKL